MSSCRRKLPASVPWSKHEFHNGQFDFGEQLDLRRFVERLHTFGLNAVLRIGPWIGQELSLGGLPSWLVNENVKLRVSDAAFLEYVQQWWWRLMREIEGLDWLNGGPIIALQIESNYGAFPRKDPTYLEDLVNRHLQLIIIVKVEFGQCLPNSVHKVWVPPSKYS